MLTPTPEVAFGKGGILRFRFRKTGRHIALTLEQMCRLFYLKKAIDTQDNELSNFVSIFDTFWLSVEYFSHCRIYTLQKLLLYVSPFPLCLEEVVMLCHVVHLEILYRVAGIEIQLSLVVLHLQLVSITNYFFKHLCFV